MNHYGPVIDLLKKAIESFQYLEALEIVKSMDFFVGKKSGVP